MAILDHVINIDPFWDEEYKTLDYEEESFNNSTQNAGLRWAIVATLLVLCATCADHNLAGIINLLIILPV